MSRLRTAMVARYMDRGENLNIHTPQNLEVLELSFSLKRIIKVKPVLLGRPILILH